MEHHNDLFINGGKLLPNQKYSILQIQNILGSTFILIFSSQTNSYIQVVYKHLKNGRYSTLTKYACYFGYQEYIVLSLIKAPTIGYIFSIHKYRGCGGSTLTQHREINLIMVAFLVGRHL